MQPNGLWIVQTFYLGGQSGRKEGVVPIGTSGNTAPPPVVLLKSPRSGVSKPLIMQFKEEKLVPLIRLRVVPKKKLEAIPELLF